MLSYSPVSFSNQKLKNLEPECRFSEEEMRQLIYEIVFESGIDHRGDRLAESSAWMRRVRKAH